MKKFFLLFFALMLSFSGFCHASDTLVYAPDKKISWEDFKGSPKNADRNKGAQITVSINLKVKKVSFWSGRVKYDAYAIAFKDESWVKAEYKDDYTLAHEQLHFDIAHIYAETLELEINNLKPEHQKERVEELLRKYIRDMVAYQAYYDRDTRGGNNVAKQKEWASKIKEELKFFN